MRKRFASIWFPYLLTDWWSRRKPALLNTSFVLATPDHGRLIITDINLLAQKAGIYPGMVVADARAIVPGIQVIDLDPQLREQLLQRIAQWCIRFTPVAAVDLPEGIILDISGCAHLWGGENKYADEIQDRFKLFGYTVKIAVADTIGAAWAVARYGQQKNISPGEQLPALQYLPVVALRISPEIVEQLSKIGLNKIDFLFNMPRSSLRRRFGEQIIIRIRQALGEIDETLQPVLLPAEYQERLPCLEPISTVKGISIALEKLMSQLCNRLQAVGKGLRKCVFKGYRIDGKIEQVQIGTNRATHNIQHLLKLFEEKLELIEPDLGIELFTLEAAVVEEIIINQEKLWESSGGLAQNKITQLLDRIASKFGAHTIFRYLPDEHHWPERSIRRTNDIAERSTIDWNSNLTRPLLVLPTPELIQVMAPIPDYPPKFFQYRGIKHNIIKADGPERIEREWWIENGQHRDYYAVEDEEGKRYWLFRLGHYGEQEITQWYLHGFFA